MHRKIAKIILHCSATLNDREVTAAEIKDWHVNGNGWSDIGYHFVIRRSGELELGRNRETSGAHTRGHNSDSLGICLVGMDRFTADQFNTLDALLEALCLQHGLTAEDIFGHYEFTDKKTCPNIKMDEFREYLKELWSHKLTNIIG